MTATSSTWATIDPSGIDMTRDVRERLALFAGEPIEIHRLALNYDQVEELHHPENPAKETDSRYQSYVDEYGESSWELDAIEPTRLAGIVTEAAEGLRDINRWNDAVEREEEMRADLRQSAKDYRREHATGGRAHEAADGRGHGPYASR